MGEKRYDEGKRRADQIRTPDGDEVDDRIRTPTDPGSALMRFNRSPPGSRLKGDLPGAGRNQHWATAGDLPVEEYPDPPPTQK